MPSAARTIFTDRDGDQLAVVPRDNSELGNPVPDPVISITRPHPMGGHSSMSVVFVEDEARQILADLAQSLLGESWGPV